MNLEELNNLSETDAKRMLVDFYNSFESDAAFYETKEGDLAQILASMFRTRQERFLNYLRRFNLKS